MALLIKILHPTVRNTLRTITKTIMYARTLNINKPGNVKAQLMFK